MTSEYKKKTTVWLYPSTISKIDGWKGADNCANRSEFMEKAVSFYVGYLSAEDTTEYLSKALLANMQGILDDNSNRLRSLLFKWCVELNMACHTIAAHFGVDDIDRRELRRFAVDEVKRTYGQISFDHALDVQLQNGGEEWQD